MARRNGKIIGNGYKYSEAMKQAALNDVKEGKSFHRIERERGMSHVTVRQWAIEAGLHAVVPRQRAQVTRPTMYKLPTRGQSAMPMKLTASLAAGTTIPEEHLIECEGKVYVSGEYLLSLVTL